MFTEVAKCILGSGFAVLVMSYYCELDPPERWRGCTFTWLKSWILVTYTSSEIWINPPAPNLWILGWDSTDWTALHPQYLANNRGRGTEIYILYVVFTARKRSCGNVMFLHLSVSHSVHRGEGMSASRGSASSRVCIQWGGLHPWGVCIQRGLHPGGFGLTPPPHRIPRDTVNERAVRILLECILVFSLFISLCVLFLIQLPTQEVFAKKFIFECQRCACFHRVNSASSIDKFEMTEKTWQKAFSPFHGVNALNYRIQLRFFPCDSKRPDKFLSVFISVFHIFS